ncbi:hypothetical protein [Pseudomonas sp. NBRC 111135]|uniref:hypothetical protein n=1 Tax=Pseudomonas sp. NBRC 111135 TaxID=1661050 RepID=UPI0006D46AA0|nr:hypothetical protein [Pseudomonas sp. NBRC 111135]
MSLLKVDPLPAYKYFEVHPSLSVEDALGMAASVNHSISDLLNLYLVQPDGEFTNLAALELSARLSAELIDASVSALKKSRKEGGEA